MVSTLFQKIIQGKIPCHQIYEDEHVFAFLDVRPLSYGHTLVIPKEPAATLDELSDESASAVGRVLPRICRAIMQATEVKEYNLLQNNGSGAHQLVMHVHFHIIPKPNEQEGLGIEWPARELNAQEGENLAKKIKQALVP
jgi:histidine triad (HIT) family protein